MKPELKEKLKTEFLKKMQEFRPNPFTKDKMKLGNDILKMYSDALSKIPE